MKKYIFLLTSFLLVSCENNDNHTSQTSIDSLISENINNSESNTSEETLELEVANKDAFLISQIHDSFESLETKTYKLYAPHTDTFILYSDNDISMTVLDSNGNELLKGDYELSINLNKNDLIYLKVTSNSNKYSDIFIEAYYKNNPIVLPYDVNYKDQDINTSYSDEANLLKAAEVNYIKRQGGTYIYSNNPEQFKDEDINTCVLKNTDLSGEIYMAFEHANYSNKDNVYLGYRIVNQENHDIYITVQNVGFQASGSWFGQKAWFDFYNTQFTIDPNHTAFADYAYYDYKPRVFTPITYKLPANEAMFVVGGTTNLSYNNINIDNSSNHNLSRIRCSNGQAKFYVSNGKATGMMLIYNDESKITNNMEEVGYVTIRNGADYGRQYKGYANHSGIIDNDMMWEFNDLTKSQLLPVTYKNKSAINTSGYKPYQEYDNVERTINSTSWMTHLNPQNDKKAVGMDMVEFICNTTDKKQVIIDNYHADGSGEAANTANWMIEYTDNFTFVNKGNNTRKVIIRMKDHGTLATLIRNSNGEVIDNFYSAGLANQNYIEYSFEVKPCSYLQVTIDYLLVACSYGSVVHEVKLI